MRRTGTLFIVTSGIMASAQPAAAYEPRIPMSLAATQAASPDERYVIASVDPAALKGKTALMIETTLVIDGRCSDRTFDIAQVTFAPGRNPTEEQSDDPTAPTNFRVSYAPAANTLTLSLTTRPLVAGERQTTMFAYQLPLLDQPDFWPAYRSGNTNPICTPGRTTRVKAQLYFSPYNMVVFMSLPGAPVAQVYTSPFKAGIGTTLFNQIVQNGNFAITGNADPGVANWKPTTKLYGLYWEFVGGVPESRQNFSDDFNLYFGAKGFPVKSPTLTRGRNAAASIYVVNQMGVIEL